MRIAICLSGQARFGESNYNEIKTKILDPAGNFDVFCYFWNTIDGRVEMDPIKAVRLYDPIRYEIVPPKIFDTVWIDHKPETEVDEKTLADHPEWVYWMYQRVLSMFYAIKQANRLRNEYEQENGFRYDCVIRSRTDLFFDTPFDLNEFKSDPNALWCYRLLPRPPEQRMGKFSYGDEFCFGSADIMDQWSSVYDIIPQAIEALNLVRPEKFLTYNIENMTQLWEVARASKMGVPIIKRSDDSLASQEKPTGY